MNGCVLKTVLLASMAIALPSGALSKFSRQRSIVVRSPFAIDRSPFPVMTARQNCSPKPHLGLAAAMARSKSSCRESSGEMGTTGQVAGFSIALLPLYRATAQTGPMEGRASLCARVPAPPEERLLLTPQARPALAASLPSPDCLPAT